MKAHRAIFHIARAIATAAALSTAAWVQAAPIDPISNPDKLEYADVEMGIPEYDVPFKRDGDIYEPATLRQIVPGLPAAQVEQLLGQAQSQESSFGKPVWHYHIKMHMPASENYLVCQYKVIFDGQNLVKEGVWRRHQCLDIMNGTAPS